jgi:acyl-coenzyme A thioesterase PaaI-like protein
MQLSPFKMKWLLRLYGPFLGAGIKVEFISADWQQVRVGMKQKFYNRNANGSHFGGSLYSMTDPHFALMLMNILGKEYLVWDSSAAIAYIKPGKGKVTAVFNIDNETIDEIRGKTESGEKYYHDFWVNIIDETGETVAKIDKTLYIRRK